MQTIQKISNFIKDVTSVLFCLLMPAINCLAQDTTQNSLANPSRGEHPWYASLWFWVTVLFLAIVFIAANRWSEKRKALDEHRRGMR